MAHTEETLARRLDRLMPGESATYDSELGSVFSDLGFGKAAVKRAKAFAKTHNCLFVETIGREPHRFEKLDEEGRPVG